MFGETRQGARYSPHSAVVVVATVPVMVVVVVVVMVVVWVRVAVLVVYGATSRTGMGVSSGALGRRGVVPESRGS